MKTITAVTIWVETAAPARVQVRLLDLPDGTAAVAPRTGRREVPDDAPEPGQTSSAIWEATTFAMHGHHYALVELTDLPAGLESRYHVSLDGTAVWPTPTDDRPEPRLRLPQENAPVVLGFGSCRTSVPHDARGHATHGVDALRTFGIAHATEQSGAPELPQTLLLLGDQVYADATSAAMREFISSRRSLEEGPGEELADFQEYAHLYSLAWGEPWVRWLLANLPTLMIFDDHDVRDDWNTSAAWRDQMARKDWWQGRIVAALGSYWVYQHLGNLSVAERARDEIWHEIRQRQTHEPHPDLTEVLDAFAARVDEHPDSYRWSYARDLGNTRLVVVDSRAARVVEPGHRAMLDEAEMAWLSDQLQGREGLEHVLLGTSLPFVLPRGLHHLEAWNEAVCDGALGPRAARWGEWLRTTVDLEHWAAFHESFMRVAAMVSQLARGERGPAPASVVFLSGDVHHSYLSEIDSASLTDDLEHPGGAHSHVPRRLNPAGTTPGDSINTRVLQMVCSPIRNPLPRIMRLATAVLAHGLAVPLGALAGRSAHIPAQPWRWKDLAGPWFTNNIAVLRAQGDGLAASWWTGEIHQNDHDHPVLSEVETITVHTGR